ncbi:RES domain-containing protein [Acrocarpospora pleiomorpha]|uniref:RES domain-containing protein n=1 Tax=Acrocarpospora pleiomorpha TaxID=90975 RepID=UPI0012D31C67|nr:RES domain-containing protein [Acrocarpospora pleiomorpha]
MLVYRVFPQLADADPGGEGHALYLHKDQGAGRLDNQGHYSVWYFALEQSGAIGEAFGNLSAWSDEMFSFPKLAGSQRSLATYALPDDSSLLDLDDAHNLLSRGLRPTQVMERNRSATQSWALRIFLERNGSGSRCWDGVRWWSFHRPSWRIVGYWGDEPPRLVKVESLGLEHEAVIDAARALNKLITYKDAVPSSVSDLGPSSLIGER